MDTKNLVSFTPQERTLMGPGPSDIHPRVLSALARPVLGHLDPQFQELMDGLRELLKYAFQTRTEVTFPISAPGSAGTEACFSNLVETGDQVAVCVNGFFGQRMYENVIRNKGVPIVLEQEWGVPVSPQKLEDLLKRNPGVKMVCFIHAETSTGVLTDGRAISEVSGDRITIMDAVASLGGSPVLVDDWKLDAVYTGSQKCLSCTPGLSPITFSDKAWEKVKKRKNSPVSWFLDLELLLNYWIGGQGKRSYHHTAPINSLYGLHESLIQLHEEGLENAWKRHQTMHELLKDGLLKLGFNFLVEEKSRAPQINAVEVPDGVDLDWLRVRLLKEYNTEVGAGLGPLKDKILRIGIMGQSACLKNIKYLLSALEESLTIVSKI